MPAGRPLKFKSAKELQEKIDAYFETTGWQTRVVSNKKGEPTDIQYYQPATITGLAVALGTNRQTLINYEDKEEFFDTIKNAKDKCEAELETGALSGQLNATFAIFSAKNNYNWKDKTEVSSSNLNIDKDGDDIISDEDAKDIARKLLDK